MADVEEGSNGFSYDFGVSIAKGTVTALAATVAGVVALTGTIVGLVNTTDQLDHVLNKNSIAFGGYARTIKMLDFVSNKVADGIGFDSEDMVEGFRKLGKMGIDAKKSMNLIAEAAKATGNSFSDMSGVVANGDFGALAEMGIITERTAMSMQNMGWNAFQASKQVQALVAEASKKGMFKDAVLTLDQIRTRLRQYKKDFLFAIVGDPKDPEGLAFNVKKYMTQIADFIGKHRNKIIFWGKIIGRTFRFVIDVVGDFIKRIFRSVSDLVGAKEKSLKTMQDQIMSFGLWIEIQRARISKFFDEYGNAIWTVIKILLIYKALKFTHNFWVEAIKKAHLYFRFTRMQVHLESKRWVSMFSAFNTGMKGVNAALLQGARAGWAFAAPFIANPIGLIVLAVIALITYVVLLIKYWDEIRMKVKDVNDVVILALVFLMPLVGIPLLLAKHWEKFKSTFTNIWATIKNVVALVGYWFKDLWSGIVNWFKEIWTGISTWFGAIWASIVSYIKVQFEPLYNLFTSIGEFIGGIFESVFNWIGEKVDWVVEKFKGIGDFFGNIMDWVTDGTSKAANKTADMLAKQQAKHGDKIDVSKGVNSAEARAKQASFEKSQQAKTPSAASRPVTPLYGSTDKIDYGTGSKLPDTSSLGGNTTNVSAGAIQINVNGGSIDENKLAALVTRQLEKLNTKKQLRTGV